MTESESVALPFGDSAIFCYFAELFSQQWLVYTNVKKNASTFFNFFEKNFLAVKTLEFTGFEAGSIKNSLLRKSPKKCLLTTFLLTSGSMDKKIIQDPDFSKFRGLC